MNPEPFDPKATFITQYNCVVHENIHDTSGKPFLLVLYKRRKCCLNFDVVSVIKSKVSSNRPWVRYFRDFFFFFFFIFVSRLQHHFYTPPHDTDQVLRFHVGRLCVCPSVSRLSVRCFFFFFLFFFFFFFFLFPDDNLSKHH